MPGELWHNGDMSHLRNELFAQRRFRQLFFGLFTLSVALGILIIPVEAGQGSISSIEEGLWWASTTVTGVGYGDFVPVTPFGRLIGVMLQVIGVGMLGIMIGIVNHQLSQRQEKLFWKREFNQFDELHDRLGKIERQLLFLVREQAEGPAPLSQDKTADSETSSRPKAKHD